MNKKSLLVNVPNYIVRRKMKFLKKAKVIILLLAFTIILTSFIPQPKAASVTILSYNEFQGDYHDYCVFGEVQNLNPDPVYFVEIDAIFYDNDNNLIGEGWAVCSPYHILPNRKASFVVWPDLVDETQISRIDHFTLEANTRYEEIAPPTPPLGLKILSSTANIDVGWIVVTGEIENVGTTSISSQISVTGTCYDSEGKVIDVGYDFPGTIDSILPGEKVSYQILFEPHVLPSAKSYVITAESEEYICFEYPESPTPELTEATSTEPELTEPTPTEPESTTPEPTTPEPTKPELTVQAYTDEENNFSIDPPSGWTVDDINTPIGSVVIFSGPTEEGLMVSINVGIESLPVTMTLEQYISTAKKLLQSTLDNYELISESTRVINNFDAYELVSTFTLENIDIKNKQVVLVNDNKAYIITYTALPTTYQKYISTIESSIKTFKFIELKPTTPEIQSEASTPPTETSVPPLEASAPEFETTVWVAPPENAAVATAVTVVTVGAASVVAAAVSNTAGMPAGKVVEKTGELIPESVKKWLSDYISSKRESIIEAKTGSVFLPTKSEVLAYGISLVVLTFSFSYVKVNDLTQIFSVLPYILVSAVIIEFVKTFALEVFARSRGVWTEHKIWYLGLAMFLVTTFAFGIPFSSPSRNVYHTTKYTKRLEGIVASIGILVVMAFAALFFVLMIGGFVLIGSTGLAMCSIMAFLDTFPVAPMSGKAIYDYSKVRWAILFTVTLTLYGSWLILL